MYGPISKTSLIICWKMQRFLEKELVSAFENQAENLFVHV
jgi:hypothetical protein